jgi:hypothetical protein
MLGERREITLADRPDVLGGKRYDRLQLAAWYRRAGNDAPPS